MAAVAERTAVPALLDGTLFDRLTARTASENDVPREHAERLVDQALAFPVASARSPEVPLAPSTAVDIGWRAFIRVPRHDATTGTRAEALARLARDYATGKLRSLVR